MEEKWEVGLLPVNDTSRLPLEKRPKKNFETLTGIHQICHVFNKTCYKIRHMNTKPTTRHRFFETTAAIAVLFLFASCNILDSKNTDGCEPGVIVPGVCIDGVKLGDSRERVKQLLGEPSGGGIADGLYRAWRTYSYRPPGRTDGLGFSILFIENEDLSLGPVDMLKAHYPYEGKTPEGIGIGSKLSDVLQAYGEPDFTVVTTLQDGKDRKSVV